MARKRSLSPEFFTDDDVADLDPLKRLLFAGMWCHCDKAGRMKDKPRSIKAKVLPFDDLDVDAALDELHEQGFIIRYQVDGGRYIQIRTWHKHQNPHHTERDSDIPDRLDSVHSVQEPLDNGVVTVQERSAPKRAPFPETKNQKPETRNQKKTVKRFQRPTLGEVAEYVKESSYHVDPQQFVDYYEANGWKVGRNAMKDWRAAVRQWERRNGEFGGNTRGSPPKRETDGEALESLFAEKRAKHE